MYSKIYTPDGALYHFPYINIINDNKIIIGLSNIHHRYGHISIMQYLSAVHYNFLFGLNGILIPLAAISIYTIIFFLSYVYEKKNTSISSIFSILIIFYITWKMNRYGEYGNDAPGHFILFVIVLLYLKSIEENFKNKKDNFYLISLLSIFVFLNKTFLILALLFPLPFFDKKIFKEFFNIKFLFLFLFMFLWIIKNTLVTGCMIYPISATCLEFSWTNFDFTANVFEVALGSEAWAKDWSNQKVNILPFNEFLKNFYWLEFWLKNHFQKILQILLPYIFVVIIFFLIIKTMKKNKDITNNINFKNYIPLYIILIIGFFLWFLKAPLYRYGYSYIICLIAVSFSILVNKNLINLKLVKQIEMSIFIIVLCIFVLTTKQIVRIYKNQGNHYINSPWPKYYSQSSNNDLSKYEKKIINKLFYYYIPLNKYCFYEKSPCSSEKVDKNLKKMINKFGYQIFYF